MRRIKPVPIQVTNCYLVLFVDDIQLFTDISDKEDCTLLQQDLDRPVELENSY